MNMQEALRIVRKTHGSNAQVRYNIQGNRWCCVTYVIADEEKVIGTGKTWEEAIANIGVYQDPVELFIARYGKENTKES